MGVVHKKLRKETLSCIDNICDRKNIDIKKIKIFGNKLKDYTEKDLENLDVKELSQIKKLLMNKINGYA